MVRYEKKTTIINKLALSWSVEKVKRFLENKLKKIDGVYWNSPYHTALSLLVSSRRTYSERDKNVIELLLKHGADPLQKSYNGDGVIALLAFKKETDLILLLLHHLRNIDSYVMYSKIEYTPLHLSVKFELKTVFDYLLSKGADVNKPALYLVDDTFSTPLHTAAATTYENGSSWVKILLQQGANLAIKDLSGLTPMMWAIHNKRIEHIKLFLEYGDTLLDVWFLGRSTLHFLFLRGKYIDLDICELFLNEGCSPKTTSRFGGKTPLHYVAENRELRNKLEITRFFLKNGADLNKRDFENNSVLHCAAQYSSSQTTFMKYLLYCGINVNFIDNRNENFLDILKRRNHQSVIDMIKFLVIQEKEKNIVIGPSIQNTMLHGKNLFKLYERCRNEAEILGGTMIDSSGQKISLLTLFNMNKRELADLCENPTVRNEMKIFFAESFPLYGKELKTKFEASLKFDERKDLCLKYLEKDSNGVLRHYSSKRIIEYIPNRVIEKIGSNLI